MDVSTSFLGLHLKNPLIVSSSGLTDSVDKIKKLEDHYAGAVVLKSLFEEQIIADKGKLVDQDEMYFWYPEAADYISEFSKEEGVAAYLELIRKAKENVSIPLIASINCMTSQEWPAFAKKIEEAGADALELNIFIPTADQSIDSVTIEDNYVKIVQAVRENISIPISIKLGSFFTNIAQIVHRIDQVGASGIVLFNRFFRPDIDINKYSLVTNNVFSSPEEITFSLRWIALLSGKTRCDLAASTGIYDASGVIKQIIAGANATYLCSVVYKKGPKIMKEILAALKEYMQQNNHHSLADFRGKIHQNQEVTDGFTRVQFMKKTAGAW